MFDLVFLNYWRYPVKIYSILVEGHIMYEISDSLVKGIRLDIFMIRPIAIIHKSTCLPKVPQNKT